MRTILIEAEPWNPTTGAVSPIALAGQGRKAYRHRGRNDWIAGVSSEPKFSAGIEFTENGFSGGARPEYGVLEFRPSSNEKLVAVSRLLWNGAAIEVFVGDDEAPAPAWATLIKGTVEAQAINGGALLLKIRDASGDLDKPAAPNRFAGTGGLEGDDVARERIKRRSWGQLSNIEALPLKVSTLIYEVGDPGRPLGAIDDVKDIGRSASSLIEIEWRGSQAATLAALEAEEAPRGGGVVAPSIACVKWWTQPVGPLTVDLRGEVSGGYQDRPATIAERLVASQSTLTITNVGEAQGWRNGVAGLHIDSSSETVAQALDRLLRGSSLAWNTQADGQIRLTQFSFANPVETVRALSVSRTRAFKPLSRRRVGFRRNHREHGEAEISAALRDDAGAILTAGAKFGTNLLEADGTTVAKQEDFKTSLGTSAAITGQGAFATVSNVSYGSNFLTGFGSLAALANVTFGSNILESPGVLATLARFLTSSGTAAAITGQGAFATVSTVSYGSNFLSGFGALAALANVSFDSNTLLEGPGIIATLARFLTSAGTAAAIAGQSPAATDPTIQPGATNDTGADTRSDNFSPTYYRTNWLLRLRTEFKFLSAIGLPDKPGAGGIYGSLESYAPWPEPSGGAVWQRVTNNAAETFIRGSTGPAGAETWTAWAPEYSGNRKPYFGLDLLEFAGGALATLANFKTGQGTAAGIAGQGAFATISSVSYGSTFLNGFGILASQESVTFGSSTILEGIGGAIASLASFKTSQGIASAIFAQAAAATDPTIQTGATNDTGADTRFEDFAPMHYRANWLRRMRHEFKQLSTLGLNGFGSFGSLETFAGWPDPSGGVVAQRVTVQGGFRFMRVSTGPANGETWTPWAPEYNGNRKPFFDADILEAAGGVIASLSNFKTIQGTAAAFSGQGILATLNQIVLNSTTIRRADGTTIVSETLVITSLGVAGAVVGQGKGATSNNLADLDPVAAAQVAAGGGGGATTIRIGIGASASIPKSVPTGQSVGAMAGIYITANQPGTLTLRLEINGGGGWVLMAPEQSAPYNVGEPAFVEVSGTWTNQTGFTAVYDIRALVTASGATPDANRSYLRA